MNTIQFIALSVIIATAAANAAWTGPFADHQIGQLVADTHEVAALKRQHAEADSQIRSILSGLPSQEINYDKQPALTHYNPVFVPTAAPHVHHYVPTVPPQAELTPTQPRWTGPLADHKLGQVVPETPEVAAARKHHEHVYSHVRKFLPELPQEERFPTDQGEGVVVPGPQFPQAPQISLGQTAEVEAARRAHFKAVMEAAAFLEKLNAAERTTAEPNYWNARPANTRF